MASRDVQFIIRARDEASRAFDGITQALQQISQWNGQAGESSNILSTDLGRLVQALGSVDQVARTVNGASQSAGNAFEQQRAKVKALEGDLANLKAQSAAAAQAMAGVKAAGSATGNSEAEAAQVKAITAAQADLEKQIGRKVTQLERERTTLDGIAKEYQRAASLANAMDAAQPALKEGASTAAGAEALQQQAVAAEQLRQRLNPVPAIQAQYREEILKTNALLKQGLITEQEHAAAIKLINAEQKEALAQMGRDPTGRPSVLGLKPYQMTNLGFQINDVVTGLASGQKPAQVFAQQIGQILQLFPKVGDAITSVFKNPWMLGATAVFISIAFAIKQAADQAERLRTFEGILKANADGANYNAEALNDNVKALQAYHLSAEEAVAISRTFIKDGLNPAYFEAFGKSAKDMSRILGIDVKDAATQVAEAFTGGYAAVAKLDDATNFLTAAERQHIRAMFESGNAADARREAFEKFQKSQRDATDEMRGPWTKAVEDFDGAWEHLKESLSDSMFANALLSLLDGVANYLNFGAEKLERINHIADTISGRRATVSLPDPTGKPLTEEEARAKANAINGTNGNGNSDPKASGSQVDQKAIDDAKEEIRLQRELQNAVTDAQRAKVAGEQAYRAEIEKTGNKAVAELKRQAASEQEITRIQQQRRQGLLGFGESFLGKREGNREDRSVLESLFNQYGIKSPQGTTLDPQKVAWCAAFVNAVLAGKGIQGTGSLSAGSFKSFGTGVKVEDAQPGDIVVVKGGGASGSHVGFFEGFGPGGSIRLLGGNQGKDGAVSISNFKRSSVQAVRRVGNLPEGYDGQDSELQNAIALGQAQDSFNHKLETEAAQRAITIKYMRDQLGLSAQALYDSQKQEEIEKAITAAKQEATDKHITFSPEQEAALRTQVGAEYDLEHATQLVNDRIKEQTDLRDALMRGIQEASQRGDDATVAALTQQLNALTPALEDAIAKAEEFWKKLPDSPAKTAALEGFRQLRDTIKDTAFQLQKLKVDAADLKVQGAQSMQGALTSGIDQAQLLGDKTGAREMQGQLADVNGQMVQLIQNLIDAKEGWLELSDAQLEGAGTSRAAIQAQILDLKQQQNQAQMLGRQFLMTGRQINESFAETATGAVQNFFSKIREGQNVVTAFWTSLVQGVADFIMQIGLAILKQAIFNAISGGSGAGGTGGMGGGLAGIIGSLFGKHHNGGIAGAPSMFISASPAVFAGAARYHSGGIAGLKPDEVPSILKRGEEVLTEQDPRHRKNARGEPGGGSRGIRQILAMGDDEIAKAVAGAAGEEVVLTHLRRNRTSIKQMLSE